MSMTREEALLHFKSNYVSEALQKNSDEFNAYFERNKAWFKEALLKALEQVCIKVGKKQEIHKDYKIMFFNYSLLRTSVVSSEYTVLVSAYNESWYLDDNASHLSMDISPIFKVLDNLKSELEGERKKYVGLLHSFDIEEILMEQAFKYFSQLEVFAIKSFQDIDEEEWLKAVSKCEEYYIRWGEYRDESYTVFMFQEREKNLEDFVEALKETEPKEKKDALMFTTWMNLNVNGLDISSTNLLFTNFKNSHFDTVSMENVILFGANFKKTRLEHCSFTNCILENMNFQDGELEEVSFKDTVLKGANFTHAKLKEVSFENSNLEEARFLKEDIPFISLSPQQLQTIIIEKD